MLGHNCFEMLLLMPTQGVSLITNFSVSHRKVTLLVYERWINGMLVRVCSVSAPVVDSLYWGAAPKLGFLQMNPGQAMETHEQGGDNFWRHDDKCTKIRCRAQRWINRSTARKTSAWTGALLPRAACRDDTQDLLSPLFCSESYCSATRTDALPLPMGGKISPFTLSVLPFRFMTTKILM